jgi:hypothetical protein
MRHCGKYADPQADGVTNVLEVVQTVLVAFRSGLVEDNFAGGWAAWDWVVP